MPVTTDQVIPRPLGVSTSNRHSVLYCIVLHSSNTATLHLLETLRSEISEKSINLGGVSWKYIAYIANIALPGK